MIILVVAVAPAFGEGVCGPDDPLACRPLPPQPAGKMTLQAQPAAGLLAAAPGYCSSVGGSTSYESISSVSVVQNQDKLTITVNVYIANPTGCTAGNSCPEYDTSPEYVNVWIDYNGNKSWEAQEKVMDEAGTGYLNLNYHGFMTFTKTVTIPAGAVSDTYLRANLGWGSDPNAPCSYSWTWGNVLDQAIHLNTKTPEIEDIEISPTNPTTTKDVTFTAKLKNMDGFDVVTIAWSGDVPSGNGNPSYKVKPAPGKHGKDKNITATLTYKRSGSTQQGSCAKSKKFDLFFDKRGDEDKDGTHNWYEYWSSSADSSCSFNAGSSTYIYRGGSYSGAQFAEYNGNVGSPKYSIWNRASMSCAFNFSIPGYNFNNAGSGIDCVEGSLTHERTHQWVDANWHSGQPDSDGDELPDAWETANAALGFDKDKAVSFAGFPYGDDEEVYCEMQGLAAAGVPGHDWANPGKQTNPPSFKRLVEETGAAAALSGQFSDRLLDQNSDGGAEQLAIDIGVTVQSAGSYRVFANLLDSQGQMMWADVLLDLEAGDQIATLLFDGATLRQRRVNGPFDLAYVVLFGSSFEQELENAYRTLAYSFNDFEPAGSEIGNEFIESRRDTNGNGLADALDISIDVNVAQAGPVTVDGFLYTPGGDVIAYLNTTELLTAGSHTLVLSAKGMDIRQSHADGPYLLRSLSLFEGDVSKDFIYNAYQTQPYRYTDFEGGEAEFGSVTSITDQGIDSNGDGLFDVLRITMRAQVNTAGQFAMVGRLFDSNGASIDDTVSVVSLGTGQQSVPLNFSGTTIRKHGMAGPYTLRYAFLYGTDGSLADALPDAYATQAYQLYQFQILLAGLTGQFSEQPQDTNGNGKYDKLSIGAQVIATQSGNVVVQARLVSQDGVELGSLSNHSPVSAEVPAWVTLSFDGKAIYASGKDGPYVLTDVRAYHTGDPAQSEIVEDAYLTAAYAWNQFEPAASIRGVVTRLDGSAVAGAVVTVGGKSTYTTDAGEYYLGLSQSGSVAIAVDPPAGLPDGPWKFYVDGAFAAEGQAATVTVSSGTVVNVDIVLNTAVDVTNLVRATWSSPRFVRATGLYDVVLTVKNTSTVDIAQPFHLVVQAVDPASVMVFGADGSTLEGNPYFDLSGLLVDGVLSSNESISKVISFQNPSRVRFNCTVYLTGIPGQ